MPCLHFNPMLIMATLGAILTWFWHCGNPSNMLVRLRPDLVLYACLISSKFGYIIHPASNAFSRLHYCRLSLPPLPIPLSVSFCDIARLQHRLNQRVNNEEKFHYVDNSNSGRRSAHNRQLDTVSISMTSNHVVKYFQWNGFYSLHWYFSHRTGGKNLINLKLQNVATVAVLHDAESQILRRWNSFGQGLTKLKSTFSESIQIKVAKDISGTSYCDSACTPVNVYTTAVV